MKIVVNIDDQLYEVEIRNLKSRPIIAIVDGVEVEVWPETQAESKPRNRQLPGGSQMEKSNKISLPAVKSGTPAPPSIAGGRKSVLAPIPGVIVSLLVKEGDQVTHGQELCIIEAMKMRNAIRATRSGTIGAVRVSVGQTINHHDVLIEFTE
jgi:biotin carboxyl carrier protein